MSKTDSVILKVTGSPKFTKTMNVIQRPSVKTFHQSHQKCHLVSVKVKGSEKSLGLIYWGPLIKNVSIHVLDEDVLYINISEETIQLLAL